MDLAKGAERPYALRVLAVLATLLLAADGAVACSPAPEGRETFHR